MTSKTSRRVEEELPAQSHEHAALLSLQGSEEVDIICSPEPQSRPQAAQAEEADEQRCEEAETELKLEAVHAFDSQESLHLPPISLARRSTPPAPAVRSDSIVLTASSPPSQLLAYVTMTSPSRSPAQPQVLLPSSPSAAPTALSVTPTSAALSPAEESGWIARRTRSRSRSQESGSELRRSQRRRPDARPEEEVSSAGDDVSVIDVVHPGADAVREQQRRLADIKEQQRRSGKSAASKRRQQGGSRARQPASARRRKSDHSLAIAAEEETTEGSGEDDLQPAASHSSIPAPSSSSSSRAGAKASARHRGSSDELEQARRPKKRQRRSESGSVDAPFCRNSMQKPVAEDSEERALRNAASKTRNGISTAVRLKSSSSVLGIGGAGGAAGQMRQSTLADYAFSSSSSSLSSHTGESVQQQPLAKQKPRLAPASLFPSSTTALSSCSPSASAQRVQSTPARLPLADLSNSSSHSGRRQAQDKQGDGTPWKKKRRKDEDWAAAGDSSAACTTHAGTGRTRRSAAAADPFAFVVLDASQDSAL